MATMHALVVPQHPTLRCRTPKQPLTRCQNSNNVTRTEALAELQALRAGLGKHLAATETALQQSAAGALFLYNIHGDDKTSHIAHNSEHMHCRGAGGDHHPQQRPARNQCITV